MGWSRNGIIGLVSSAAELGRGLQVQGLGCAIALHLDERACARRGTPAAGVARQCNGRRSPRRPGGGSSWRGPASPLEALVARGEFARRSDAGARLALVTQVGSHLLG